MGNPRFLSKRMIVIICAAICGAILADGLILLDVLTSWMWNQGRLSKTWYDAFWVLATLETIPSSVISHAVGHQHGLINEYVVNGILGAVLFGLVATWWQFWFRNPQNKGF